VSKRVRVHQRQGQAVHLTTAPSAQQVCPAALPSLNLTPEQISVGVEAQQWGSVEGWVRAVPLDLGAQGVVDSSRERSEDVRAWLMSEPG
jgi:hypothetical protein